MCTSIKNFNLILFVFFFVTYGYFFQGGGWNQNSRLCMTRAVVEKGTFIIDHFKEDSLNPPFEFINTGDWSYYKGHYYSSKPPGLSLLATVPYGCALFVLKRCFPEEAAIQVHLAAYACTLFTVSLCASLLCLLMFHVIQHFFCLSARHCLTLTLMWGLGTLCFPYATAFYSYLPAAFLSLLAFVLAMHIRNGSSRYTSLLALCSGFAAAAAVLMEPTTVFMLAATFIYLLSCKTGRRHAILFLAGCLPCGIIQCLFNQACFGSIFATGFDYENSAVIPKINGSQFTSFRPRILMELLVLPYRGMLITTPLFLMVLPGVALVFKKKLRVETVLFGALTVAFLMFETCFLSWSAGAAPGPRHLLPVYPFVFLLTVPAFSRFPKTFIAVGSFSIIVSLSITLVGVEIPASVHNPLLDVVLKNITAGHVSINPVPFSNFERYDPSMLDNISGWEQNFNSFNLGEFLFPHHIASLLPLAAFLALGILVLWRLSAGISDGTD
jgi:hypothetical protein